MNPQTIIGYTAKAKGQALEPVAYPAPVLKEHEVRVAISHCGLCYTDIQAIEDFYEITDYPFVPGHEVVGHVCEVGKSVMELREGDRVGIGWQGRACGQCEWCASGEANLCLDVLKNASWTPYGGFSSSIAVDAGFAYPLPPKIPSETAAVLMCAGISVFAPLHQNYTHPSQRIGIIGIGGLGHLAIQYAKAMGYEVTAISSSPGKKEEAIGFGADQFILASDRPALRKAANYFDVLLSTAHAGVDWEAMHGTLKRKGKLLIAGFSEMSFKPIDLVAHQLTMTGSFLGTQDEMRAMLAFSEIHAIHPLIEVLPMTQINAAIEKLIEGKVRYRVVLVNDLGV